MGKKPCSVLIGNVEHPTGFIAYTLLTTGPELKIRTQLTDSPNERRILVRHNKKRIVAVCRFVLRNGPTEIVEPYALEIEDDIKKTETQSLTSSKFSIANLTSTREIAYVVEANRKKIMNYVTNFFESELRNLAPYYKIYFAAGESTDMRLRQLTKQPRIIYYSPDPPSNFKPQQYFPQDIYLAEIQRSDLKIPVDLKAELTIPILYRQKLAIGYVQINTTRFVDDATFQTVKKIAVAAEAQLRKIGLTFEEEQILPITNIDMKTIDFIIVDRLLLRHFQPNLNLLFRILKHDEPLGHFAATVSQSTNLGNGKTRIVLTFQEMDAMAELNLEEALAS
ncbi:MAG TPA: hypothetical protein PLY93_03620 [Turneriella sp.]|nr:hypothetical protein [Turneriella sp.]